MRCAVVERGERGVLTAEPLVEALASSGTSAGGGCKLVPCGGGRREAPLGIPRATAAGSAGIGYHGGCPNETGPRSSLHQCICCATLITVLTHHSLRPHSSWACTVCYESRQLN